MIDKLNTIGVLFAAIAIGGGAFAVGSSQVSQSRLTPPPTPGHPPAMVKICGLDNNGIWIPHDDVEIWLVELEAQGCFRRDIRVIEYSKRWSFVYGVQVLIGE